MLTGMFQAQVQRLLSLPSLRAGQAALWLQVSSKLLTETELQSALYPTGSHPDAAELLHQPGGSVHLPPL